MSAEAIISLCAILVSILGALVSLIARMAYGRLQEVERKLEEANKRLTEASTLVTTHTSELKHDIDALELRVAGRIGDVEASVAGFGSIYPSRKELDGALQRLESNRRS
jgi:hypothetical protein